MSYQLTQQEQDALRRAGKILSSILVELEASTKPGMTTADLEAIATRLLEENGAEASFKGYQGYPAALCTSINNEVVHCIPSEEKVIVEGDIVSIDFGVHLDGVHADAARSYIVGEGTEEAKKLVAATKRALDAAIAVVKPGATVGDIGAAVESVINPLGYGIVTKLVGHGIGPEIHLEPQIPNMGTAGKGDELVLGQAIAIEPMINAGTGDVDINDWEVLTTDGSLSAHFEDTILITENGAELMTRQ